MTGFGVADNDIRPVRENPHVWIPMSDGCRLSGRIWMPEDAEDNPVPAILEYIPYRKNDGTAARDAARQPRLAQNGYAAVRVDLRGSGDSEGLLLDEYLQQELEDACEVIGWLAEQPWCSGSVGMTGISWGGFNALQVASLRPPSLKAIISVCSTDDRYADDVHYTGGCVIGSDMLSWASTMFMAGARPPDPSQVGDGWREAWFERMQVRPFVEQWLSHQRRDGYWRHGSVCEDYSAMDCAVYMVGGWDDPYRDSVFRVLGGYDGPRKGLIGPWGHNYPDQGKPGEPIDFFAESVRFWDHWLKGIDTGIMDEPMLTAFMVEPSGPDASVLERNGHWVNELSWPSPNVTEQEWALGSDGLGVPRPVPGIHEVRGVDTAGLDAGIYVPEGSPDLAGDQRREDGLALSFTSEPLTESVAVLGRPTVTLSVSADRPNALVAVRLCEVGPSGASRLISRGLLNLTHRDGHTDPKPVEAGQRYTVKVQLSATAFTFPKESRLRVAISPTYWPWAWPSPQPVVLRVFTGEDTALHLPVRTPRAEDGDSPAFVLPEEQRAEWALLQKANAHGDSDRTVTFDAITGQSTLTIRSTAYQDGDVLPQGLRVGGTWEDSFSIMEGDPLSATAESKRSYHLQRGDWRVEVVTSSTMTSDESSFLLTNSLDAYEGNTRVFSEQWVKQVPRDHV